MTDLLKRIAFNPDIFGGKPIIRGLRISVEMILDLLSQGVSEDEILEDYPMLERQDIRACLVYTKDIIKKKEAFLMGKGFKFLSSREVWISKTGEISREFVEDHSLEEIERKISKAEKASEYTKMPFKRYNT